MNSLVFIVEDDVSLRNVLIRYLEKAGISFIFAANLIDALELFNHNQDLITYIALDGNLGGHSVMEVPETLVLAQHIVRHDKFKGTIFAMSSFPSHNSILKSVLGKRCEIIHQHQQNTHIKIDTIREIIKRIKEKIAVK